MARLPKKRGTRRAGVFQSTRHLRGATSTGTALGLATTISIHAPLTWRDTRCRSYHLCRWGFQSTRHLRGATGTLIAVPTRVSQFQSTRHLRGATSGNPLRCPGQQISIHAPLTWRDELVQSAKPNCHNFNPRATYVARRPIMTGLSRMPRISIHAPLTWRDLNYNVRAKGVWKISIHAPLTWRDDGQQSSKAIFALFQSTRHLRGATARRRPCNKPLHISIHAPLTWRDSGRPSRRTERRFQSTRHLRGATRQRIVQRQRLSISIHAPLTWRDSGQIHLAPSRKDFNPRATYVARPD